MHRNKRRGRRHQPSETSITSPTRGSHYAVCSGDRPSAVQHRPRRPFITSWCQTQEQAHFLQSNVDLTEGCLFIYFFIVFMYLTSFVLPPALRTTTTDERPHSIFKLGPVLIAFPLKSCDLSLTFHFRISLSTPTNLPRVRDPLHFRNYAHIFQLGTCRASRIGGVRKKCGLLRRLAASFWMLLTFLRCVWQPKGAAEERLRHSDR